MKIPEVHPHHSYALLIFGIAAAGYGLKQLVAIGTDFALGVAGILTGLVVMITFMGLIHYWRHC